jgi:hypothetical protein
VCKRIHVLNTLLIALLMNYATYVLKVSTVEAAEVHMINALAPFVLNSKVSPLSRLKCVSASVLRIFETVSLIYG